MGRRAPRPGLCAGGLVTGPPGVLVSILCPRRALPGLDACKEHIGESVLHTTLTALSSTCDGGLDCPAPKRWEVQVGEREDFDGDVIKWQAVLHPFCPWCGGALKVASDG